jgi:hypothetical protein
MPTLANPFDPIAVPDLLAWFEPFAHALVPEWASMPVYAVDTRLPGCFGLVDRLLDMTYQDRIAGWRGRGACIALDLRAMREVTRLERWFRPAQERHFRRHAVATFTHELAHIVAAPAPYGEPRKNLTPRSRRKAVSAALRELDESEVSAINLLTLLEHDARFIRAAAHLVCRANRLGVDVWLGDVAAGSRYELSPGREYFAALRDEAEAMGGETFATIKATPPPKGFTALWRVDVLNWASRITNPNDLQLAAATAALSIFPKESE